VEGEGEQVEADQEVGQGLLAVAEGHCQLAAICDSFAQFSVRDGALKRINRHRK
jgi:hypothetical protein